MHRFWLQRKGFTVETLGGLLFPMQAGKSLIGILVAGFLTPPAVLIFLSKSGRRTGLRDEIFWQILVLVAVVSFVDLQNTDQPLLLTNILYFGIGAVLSCWGTLWLKMAWRHYFGFMDLSQDDPDIRENPDEN